MHNDSAALEELFRTSPPGTTHTLLHYLYFPGKAAAATAAVELERRLFETEVRLGGDGLNWLVLATHHIVPSQGTLAETRDVMKRLAETNGGEYDGWEAET